MTSQQIQALLAPPNVPDANLKVVNLLNSRFQTVDDLDELEALVLDAQQRDDELQSNLALSRSKIDALLADTHVSTETYIHTAQELSLLRHSLTDELAELSQELISTLSDGEGKSTLLEDIETLHRNLKELQSVKSYVQVAEHALKLSELSAERIRGSKSISASSLAEYQTLQAFVAKVSEACSKVENGSSDQTLHLVQFLESIRDKTWADIRGTLSSSLNAAAEKIGWPMAVDYSSASAEDRAAFEYTFRNLLKLQTWGEKIRNPRPPQQGLGKDGLYPLQALVQPISLRFKYHFEGNRQTNRLDKPEWYFTHILNVAHEHRTFMESVIQRLLESSEYQGISAWHEFTYLLLPLLSRKLKHTVPSLLPHPPLLAHTIYQALTFDAALAEEGFLIQETSAAKQRDSSDKWEGVSEVILGNSQWFDSWVHGEQQFAEDQYHEIIGASDAWLIAADDEHDEDSHNGDMKSTTSARRICSLVEQVTDRYSPLPRFEQRTRFLLSAQLPLLDHYHGRIVSSLDAFETLSSAFVRAVPGALGVNLGGKEEGRVYVDNRGLTSGVEGVQRLCKALLSAKYVESAMRSWGEELFFVELWTEINHNSSLRSQAVASPLLPDPTADSEEIPSDTLFRGLLSRYEHLVNRAEGMVVQQVFGEIESLLKAHFATPFPDRISDHADEISVSQTLLAPIALLSSHLTFLRATMPQAILTTLYRRIAARLAEHILQRQIIFRGHFDLREGKNIRAECELWVETCRAALGGGLPGGRARVEAPWTKLLQAASLASAEGDTWAAIVEVTFGTQDDDEWELAMTPAVGALELGREEVARILRRREDCGR
ncbi:putative RINT-1 / TIP-1 family protein [Lyophyllum shimeji]|uniref:RINT-1 / TIP-1 family protein n=1 Tax=Lyophyllum shimeji TaxID=47721 RepID=A0A9P3PI00_LYOSH|nr:putative RINT-1 / TIP-1 family protein [Lyophyllum shimeji]